MSFYDKHLMPQKTNTNSSKSKQPSTITPANYQTIIQRVEMHPQSFSYADAMVLQRIIGNQAVGRLMRKIGLKNDNSKPVQREVSHEEEEPLMVKKENKTGLPDDLKSGVENISGIDMSDVRVHYSSDKSAQIGALAYTQGTKIHVAALKEQDLPHEAWHVVQQAQERVQPTIQRQGLDVKDDVGLEKMGDKALRNDIFSEQVKQIKNLVTMNGITQLKRTGTLLVDAVKDADSVDIVPRDEDYNVGFNMDVSLDIDKKFPYSTLQENFELTQYVRDKYDFFNNDGDSIDSQILSAWARDGYGRDDDGGDWNSDGNSTSWQDTPGWTGSNTVNAGYLLSEYAVDFYFTVEDDKGKTLHTSSEINLRAESDDSDKVTYTTPSINETIDYDPDEEE